MPNPTRSYTRDLIKNFQKLKHIGILPENAKDEDLDKEKINISVVSSLLGNLGFIENNGINEKD